MGKTRTAWRKTTTTIYCKQRELRLDELARCLSISQEDAMSLLISLGYELKDNQYIPCYSEEAVQNRRRWEKKKIYNRQINF